MHIAFGHLGPFCGNQGIGEKISILIHVFTILPGSSRNPVGGIETFPLPFKASRHGPAEYAGKFCHQLVQKLVILFIFRYRHIKRNEMDPSPAIDSYLQKLRGANHPLSQSGRWPHLPPSLSVFQTQSFGSGISSHNQALR